MTYLQPPGDYSVQQTHVATTVLVFIQLREFSIN